MQNGFIIVDLDGTLCDSRHREHLAQAGEWDAFHAASKDDKPFLDVAETLSAICAHSEAWMTVIALTGRNEAYRQMTKKWFDDWNVSYCIDDLIMRPDNDYRPDTVLKPFLLAEHFGSLAKAKDQVLMILEDRDKVVEMWRDLGFNCWQVRPGGY